MKIIETLSMWRKILIAILSLLMIVSAIIIGNLHSIIHYNYEYVKEWDYNNLSHIGNINHVYNDYGELLDNWVNIGNRYWYSNDLRDVESDKELGDLIRLYSYNIDDKNNPHYGETASLWIYDISKEILNQGMIKDTFYKYIHDKCSKDTTSLWRSTDEFKPFLALFTRPRAVFSLEKTAENPIYEEDFMIFANYRIYYFNFSNAKFRRKGLEGFNYFHNRCKTVIEEIDINSFSQWEKDYKEYKELSEKEDYERELWSCILYGIVFICCICIFVLNIRKIGKINKQARLLVFYVIVCLAIGLIIMAIGAFDSPCKNETVGWLVFVFFPSFVICMLMITFLSKKSRDSYNTYYLIPDVAIRYLNINTEYKKRLSLLFMFYPLFFIVPIPVIGLVVFVCYVLPMALFILICLKTRKAIAWLKEGKKLDSKTNAQSEKARIYCRHCGKLIDADSDYCRYCGKKL